MINRLCRGLIVAVVTAIILAGCSKPGNIHVASLPAGARVTIDGRRTNFTTPCDIEASAGDHQVSCALPGFHKAVNAVDLPSAGTRSITAHLRPVLTTGSIQLLSDPSGARVVIDGKALDKATPATLDGVEPGRHTVIFSRAGYRQQREVADVVVESTSKCYVRLSPLPLNVVCASVGQNSVLDTIGEEVYAVQISDGRARKLANLHSSVFALAPAGDLIACTGGSSNDVVTFLDNTGTTMRELRLGPIFEKQYNAQVGEIGSLSWHPFKKVLLISFTTGIPDSQGILATYDYATGRLKLLESYEKSGIRIPNPSQMGERLERILSGKPSKKERPQVEPKYWEDRAGAYSPDGKQIVFARGPEIYVADTNLKNLRCISRKLVTSHETPFGSASYHFIPPFAWSPDGRHVLCCKSDEGYVLTPHGDIKTTIAGLRPGACWTPDGRILGMLKDEQGALFTIDPENGSRTRILTGYGAEQLACGILKDVGTGQGTLSVTSSSPGLKIFIDDKISGEITPHGFSLSPGPYLVQVQKETGMYSAEKSVTVRPGEVTRVKF